MRPVDMPEERMPALRVAALLLCLITLSWFAAPSLLLGESVASMNRRGNRLFEGGKFQEAERAYLEAQAESPDRPELLYNLGNSLIKQKKYDQALQSLRRATDKSSQELQASSWYNIGNASFDRGDFKDAAEAYVEALKIRPADRDAKYNLELALRNLQQQKKQQDAAKDSGNDQQESDEDKQRDQNAGEEGNDNRQQRDRQNQQKEQNEQDGTRRLEQSRQSAKPEEQLTKEQALQILDALRNEELLNWKKLQARPARQKAIGKDW